MKYILYGSVVLPNKCQFRKAFTLAEVMVTLAIIGVVASMTIPALIKTYEEQTWRTKAKYAASLLTSTFSMAKADFYTFDYSENGSSSDLRDKMCEYLKCYKTGTHQSLAGYSEIYYYKSSVLGSYVTAGPALQLHNDGMIISFVGPDEYSIYLADCVNQKGNLTGVCGYIKVDTNGVKSPNMFGKDLLDFWVVKKNGDYRVIPVGGNNGDDGFECIVGSTNHLTSRGCAALYIENKEIP